MKRSEPNRLLREILAGDALERVRAESLARGIAVLKTRRRRRAIVTAVCASVLIGISAFTLRRHHAAIPVSDSAASAPENGVKVISDEQLLSLFADRSAVLVGRPGAQRLVLLERAPAVSR